MKVLGLLEELTEEKGCLCMQITPKGAEQNMPCSLKGRTGSSENSARIVDTVESELW